MDDRDESIDHASFPGRARSGLPSRWCCAGLVRDWPAVAGRRAVGREAAAAYLAAFRPRRAASRPLSARPRSGAASSTRRDMAGFNFERRRGPFGDVLRDMLDHCRPSANAPAVYIGSAPVPEVAARLRRRATRCRCSRRGDAVPRIWIGNREHRQHPFRSIRQYRLRRRRAAALHPVPARPGRQSLYRPARLTPWPASRRAWSTLTRSRFRSLSPLSRGARRRAAPPSSSPATRSISRLCGGTMIEALDPFNVLVNYWWRDVPPDRGSVFEAMVHAILTIGHAARASARGLAGDVRHYVFRPNGDPAEHLPPGSAASSPSRRRSCASASASS